MQSLPVLSICDADTKKYCQRYLTGEDGKHIKSVDMPVGVVNPPLLSPLPLTYPYSIYLRH